MMRRAFSLIELLLAVFILAIGIISVSALFPAGIAQQQQTTDDQLGPVVAEQALGLLRSRVRPEDFGSFEEFGILSLLSGSTQSGSYAYRPAPGDWSWIRPGVIRTAQPDVQLPAAEQPGSIDLFSRVAQRTNGTSAEFCEFPQGIEGNAITLYGAPYSTARSLAAPLVVVSQRERWWPDVTSGAAVQGAPQYAWECMFRRSGGRVQVAIFVFRVVGVGGAVREWRAFRQGQNSTYDPAVSTGATSMVLPPVPYRRVLSSAGTTVQTATTGDDSVTQVAPGWAQPLAPALDMGQPGPFTTGLLGQGVAANPGALGQGLLPGDFPTTTLPPVQHQWQFPGQWIVDNNGNVHRVAVGRRNPSDAVQVRLSAPVPRVPAAQVHVDYEAAAVTSRGVRTFHFVPAIIDGNGTQLVPVYATVRDL
jgi:prepilin-type N-terminal cleavage/methylation domain-containing protein